MYRPNVMTSFKDKYKDCWSHSKICSNSATCYLGICIGRSCGGREAILDGGSHRTRQPPSTTTLPQPPIFLLQPPKCAEIFPHQFPRISSSQMTGPSIHHKTNVKFRYFGKRTVLDTGGLSWPDKQFHETNPSLDYLGSIGIFDMCLLFG